MKMRHLFCALAAALCSGTAQADVFEYRYFGNNTVGTYGIGFNAPFSGSQIGLSFFDNGIGFMFASVPIGYGGHVDGFYWVDKTVLGNVHTFTGGMIDSLQNSGGNFIVSGIYDDGVLTRAKGTFFIGGQVYPTSSFWAVQGSFWESNAIPEPRSWALMVLGFATLGQSYRRARRKRVDAAAIARLFKACS